MRGRDILKQVMELKGLTNAMLAKRLNLTNNAIWERLNNKNVKDIPASMLSDMLREMDYMLIAVPNTTRIPDNGFKVD